MSHFRRIFGLCLVTAFVASCSNTSSTSQLTAKPLTLEEKRMDFDVAVNYFKSYYAPLQYKEKKLNVKYDEVFTVLRTEVENSKSDQDFYRVLGKLVSSFQDGHVSVSIPGMSTYSLPFSVDHFDGHYVVTTASANATQNLNINVGDELLTLDGKSAGDHAKAAMKYRSFGYERSSQRFAAYKITHLDYEAPVSRQARLKLKRKSDGAVYDVDTFWTKSEGVHANQSTNLVSFRSEMTNIGMADFGAKKSFFATPQVENQFQFIKAKVDQEQWEKSGQKDQPADVYSVLYRHEGKTVLLVRIPSYSVTDTDLRRYVKTYELLLTTYSSVADVLVIDQTHNPGGNVEYVEELARLFLKTPGPTFAFAPRADRLWLRFTDTLLAQLPADSDARTYFANLYKLVETAQEKGEFLAPPFSLTRSTTSMTENTAWSKPVLLLIDEMCGSGGDGFPMIMKGNHAATLFGHRTSGMGGNVDGLPALPNSGAQFQMTRSLFYLSTPDGSLPETAIIENNGVSPDQQRDYGLSDFQEGYTTYVKDFSSAAVKLIK